MPVETAAPPVDESTTASTEDQSTQTADAAAPEAQEAPAKTEAEIKIELLERQNKQLKRGIDRKTARMAELQARAGLTQEPMNGNNRAADDDSETVSLTRAELTARIQDEAERLAPAMRQQAAEAERRQGVIGGLQKAWGSQKFDQIASDLDDAFGGLADRSGAPRPAVEAVFEADSPAQVIEYLADPEHADEAEAIAGMSAARAGKAIARLEDKLKAAKDKAKPQPSSAAEPLEKLRGAGPASKALRDLSDDAFEKRRREQIKARR